jgi:hypothetical protein
MSKAPRFVVYHVRSTMERKRFYHANAAKKLVEALGPDYAFNSIENYNNDVVYMVTRVNMMTGMQYQEPSNTPGYMSPSSEAYWSM